MTRATPAATAPAAGPAGAPAPAPVRARRRRPGRSVACAALTLLAFIAATARPTWTWTALALSAGVVGWGGAPVYRSVGAGLRHGALTADVLPAAGLLAVFAAAAWSTARGANDPLPLVTSAAVTTLLLAGRQALRCAERRAASALEVVPPGISGDGAGGAVATELVQGDRFAVGPGEQVGVDAVVVEGRSAVLPGDARAPVEVGPGDRIAAGGCNAGNRLVLEVATARDLHDRTADEARRGADALRRVAERTSAVFAGFVVVVAVATLGFWLGAGAGVPAAVGAAGAVLLAACPRAAGSAAAAAVLTATGRAVASGAVPTGPRVLERAARVDTVLLCRTGTVTSGVRRLRSVHIANGVDPDEALRLAGAVANAAQEAGGVVGGHAVGPVVAAEARSRFGKLPGVAEFDGYPGLGVRGVVTELRTGPDGDPRVLAHATLLGRAALLTAHGIALPPELVDAVERVNATGATAVAVSWDGVARAVLEIDDPVRPGTAAAVRRLRGLGLTPVLLTGDDAGAARGLAAVVGIDPSDVLAGVTPDMRAAAVADLRARGRTVAVLGGPADADALAAADVALVRGSPRESPAPAGRVLRLDSPCGSDDDRESPGSTGRVRRLDSLKSTGFALVGDDPLTGVDALRIARRAVRTVERVLTATVAFHLVALPLAVTGLLPPLVAAAAAAVWPFATVAAVVTLRRVRPLKPPAS